MIISTPHYPQRKGFHILRYHSYEHMVRIISNSKSYANQNQSLPLENVFFAEFLISKLNEMEYFEEFFLQKFKPNFFPINISKQKFPSPTQKKVSLSVLELDSSPSLFMQEIEMTIYFEIYKRSLFFNFLLKFTFLIEL